MTEVKPVAWKTPYFENLNSRLVPIFVSVESNSVIQNDWVPLYAEPDFIAMKERAEKADAELERTERNRDMYKGQCDRQAKELEKLRITKTAIRNEAINSAAIIGYATCAETRHVTLGESVAKAIRDLKDKP